ncbi:MAG TPA: flagellar biosynthesis protein FlhA [Planctomycetota bacterium]|nr:flagellar biosynthesis protein FlhA [Planctomycetota bacterium]
MTERTMPIPGAADAITKHRGLVMAILIVALPAVIIAQLPTGLMDVLLSVNLTLAIVILLTTIYVERPLDFSVFPSMLLVTTLFRLVLNVATTRLILTNAKTEGELAAGAVIRAFGKFVSGNNALVGFIIFAILVIVQFVVITKGATRISEVAARFTLDGMPGKQMAIDADLNAGLITEDEARRRRADIGHEADFYGAMDGASKYVRGDAIAGILITLINIIGGLIIGMLQYKFTFEQALKTYTLLTVGDGLVSQIPAFIISIAAGLIVTRATDRHSLGEELVSQLGSSPKALGIAAGFSVLMAFTGLPALPMLGLAAVCGFAAVGVSRGQVMREQDTRRRAEERQAPQGPPPVESVDLRVDPLELDVGYGLIRLVDPRQGGDLLDRIGLIRRQMGTDLGLVVPPVRIRDNVQLDANAYEIRIRGNRVASGTALPDQYLAMDSGMTTGTVEGTRTAEPAFGLTAYWIPAAQRQKAEMLGYTVVDTPTVIATHLTEVIKRHAHEVISREDVQKLIARTKEAAPTVVDELIPGRLAVGEVQKVLQNLLREGVSIRNLEVILETLSDYAARTRDTEILTEYARNAVARSICSAVVDDAGRLHVVTLDPALEDAVNQAVQHTDAGSYLSLEPNRVRRITRAVAKECEKLTAAGHPAVLLVSPQIRVHLKRMTEPELPSLVVLSYNEIVQDIKVESMGMVVIE